MNSIHKKIIVICWILRVVLSARILGVYQVPSYSHFQLGDVLFKELARRGHDVTIISPYEEKEKTENFRTIVLTGAIEFYKNIRAGLIKRTSMHPLSIALWNEISWTNYAEYTLNHTNVQTLLKSNETFDLVIIEHLYNNAHKGFCFHYNAPCVITSSLATSRFISRKTGNPSMPSYIPEPYQQIPFKMNFFQRCINFIAYFLGEASHHLLVTPQHDDLMRKYFPNAPSLTELYYNISLILINSHPSTNPVTPLLPNMIQIGGYHIKPTKKLPTELQQYLDNSSNGAILLSLGSNILAKDVPKAKLNEILNALSRLKQNVLWKWDDETLPNVPPNVKISKWYPQNDVLAHPNIKLFITHCGLLSSVEAIHHGVPYISVPIFGDQFVNSLSAETAGYSIIVPYNELNEEKLVQAVYDIFNNSKYSSNIKQISKIMRDRPMEPLATAVYWIEYVLRNNGAYYLRSAALDLLWYQYMLFDVIAFFATITVFFTFLLWIVCKQLICKLSSVAIKNKRD
ncbi:hypothetical protein RN001_012455 [Aquatica leii]|uniref:UDP-glucuronosyltransferase n=1 Tax=Aquatica leii TaxID=1421715 RepID=A0AAN7QEV8_9COLE|nr:hypothetical protein RN001_012455 [Aquatica leii]